MMRTKKQWIFVLGLSAIIAGCNNEKDYYQNPLDNLKPEGEYFDFATRDKVSVSLDMGAIGANSIYEVYLENPVIVKENGLAELNPDIKPVYADITDQTGRSEASIKLPTASKKVYLLNRNALLPGCVELGISNERTISFTNDDTDEMKSVRATLKPGDKGDDWYVYDDGIKYGKDKVLNAIKDKVSMTGMNALYSLCRWSNNVKLSDITFTPSNYAEPSLRKESELTAFASQAGNFYPEGKDNSQYAGVPSTVNLRTDDKKEYTNINLVVLGENAGWHSPFGYFYYKAGNEPTKADLESDRIPKYIILPDASDNVQDTWTNNNTKDGMFKLGQTIHLQFFGENYDQEASYNFPPGYVIGWFIIGDGTTHSKNDSKHSWTFKNKLSDTMGFCTSLDTKSRWNEAEQKYEDVCVNFAVATNSSRSMMFLGVEDDKVNTPDYNDLMFYVEANPLTIPDVPIFSDKEEHTTYSVNGTYAFEDQWPDGGDYDLNDVATEYVHSKTVYSKNSFEDDKLVSAVKYVEELKSTFKFTQASDAATFNNAFGIELKGLDKSAIQSVTLNGETAQLEAGNPIPSIIVVKNARTAIGKTFELVIKLKENVVKSITVDYNPFIVENNDGSAPQRKEVHLPKQTPTALGWNEGNINQYYVDGMTGAYPFAIDIPILNWELVTEGIAIGSKNGEYPTFRNWADSFGKTHTDWYNHK